ncbi:hypothetical protein N7G274_008386 [Stereocaulon virgatum]|uniref:Uncharacterized protein n=1 Tax=Stereocaulon virgatum TaxID=373712 RepID=A0ABR3ZYV1_9LECA
MPLFNILHRTQKYQPGLVMAPHALQDPHDSTGYTPLIVSRAKLLPYIQIRSKPKSSASIRTVLTSNAASDESASKKTTSPYFWHLSREELRHVEASVNHFQCKLSRSWVSHSS